MTINEIEVTIYRGEYNYIVAFDVGNYVMYREMSLDANSPNGVNMLDYDFYDTGEMEQVSQEEIKNLGGSGLLLAINKIKEDLVEDYNNQK